MKKKSESAVIIHFITRLDEDRHEWAFHCERDLWNRLAFVEATHLALINLMNPKHSSSEKYLLETAIKHRQAEVEFVKGAIDLFREKISKLPAAKHQDLDVD